MNSSHVTKAGLLALSALMLASGCYTTTVRSGKPPGDPTAEYDGKWHSGVVWGIAELSGPYDLSEICPNGWAEITTETSFVNGLVDGITSGIYNPQSVTVRCAAGGAAPAAEPEAEAEADSETTDEAAEAPAETETPAD
jgi:hypothetical protein